MIDPTTLATLVVADYLGDTADDGKYEGHGSAVFKSGHSYEGEFLRGFMHGEGTFSWRDGVRFQGDFVRNKISGRGEYVWKNGCTYVGEVEDGLRHGMGEFSCAFNGAVYTGEWKEGKQHGRGIILYANGSKYEGQWTEGLKEGHGVMYYPNGNVYDGEWLKNVKHGVGRMDWNDCGETYQGEWMHGLPHGKGAYIWTRQMSKLDQFPLENRYEGDWENGKRSGKGTFYYASGAAYSGEWKDNLKHGAGHFISENGRSYIGFFKNDRPVDEWPKHQNDCPFTFSQFALAQLVEEAGFDEDVKLLNSAVLRHISLLRDLYTGYCKVGRSNSGGANSIARVQLWKFLIDCKLAKKGVHLVETDRAQAVAFRDPSRNRSVYDNPHDETAQFIFFEFVEAVLRISHIVYRNQQNLSLHERGLVACFSAFLTHDVIPNRQPEPQDFESSGDPSAMDFEGLFSKKVFDVYTLLARSRKTSLPESKNDKTITIRELLFHLSDFGLVGQEIGLISPTEFLSQVAALLPAVFDSVDCNLNVEIVPLELFHILLRCATVIATGKVDEELSKERRAIEQSGIQLPDENPADTSVVPASGLGNPANGSTTHFIEEKEDEAAKGSLAETLRDSKPAGDADKDKNRDAGRRRSVAKHSDAFDHLKVKAVKAEKEGKDVKETSLREVRSVHDIQEPTVSEASTIGAAGSPPQAKGEQSAPSDAKEICDPKSHAEETSHCEPQVLTTEGGNPTKVSQEERIQGHITAFFEIFLKAAVSKQNNTVDRQ